MPEQLTMPGLDEYTGLTATAYLDRLITLVTKCAGMDPDRYMRELNNLSRMREAGRMTEQQKKVFHCLEGLAEINAKHEVIERDYGQEAG